MQDPVGEYPIPDASAAQEDSGFLIDIKVVLDWKINFGPSKGKTLQDIAKTQDGICLLRTYRDVSTRADTRYAIDLVLEDYQKFANKN